MTSRFRNLVPKNLINVGHMPGVYNVMKSTFQHGAAVVLALAGICQVAANSAEPGLVGHWMLQGDCRDSSGQGNHGINRGVDLEHGAFDGAKSFIEVPASDSLKLGKSDFAICAWVNSEKELDDIVGDV